MDFCKIVFRTHFQGFPQLTRSVADTSRVTRPVRVNLGMNLKVLDGIDGCFSFVQLKLTFFHIKPIQTVEYVNNIHQFMKKILILPHTINVSS